MPELPEVETVRRGLSRKLKGRKLLAIEARRRDLRWPLPKNLRLLEGLRLNKIDRRAKYLLFRFGGGTAADLVLLAHLGMSGRMALKPAPVEHPGRHDHVLMTFSDHRALVYSDPRRFGMMDLIKAEKLDAHPRLAGLGPEPMSRAFTAKVLARALKGRKSPIKAALSDQKLVAGLGNIYVTEALFRAGVSPRARADKIPPAAVARLVRAIKHVLADAIKAGGSSLRDFAHANGELGGFQAHFKVYDRAGEPCPKCGAPIRRLAQAGRSSFYCAQCQR